MRTECYEFALRYSEAELHAIFALARTEDVDAGGRTRGRRKPGDEGGHHGTELCRPVQLPRW